jgi:hypothetical protein
MTKMGRGQGTDPGMNREIDLRLSKKQPIAYLILIVVLQSIQNKEESDGSTKKETH